MCDTASTGDPSGQKLVFGGFGGCLSTLNMMLDHGGLLWEALIAWRRLVSENPQATWSTWSSCGLADQMAPCRRDTVSITRR